MSRACPDCGAPYLVSAGTLDQTGGTLPALVLECLPCQTVRTEALVAGTARGASTATHDSGEA